MNALPNMNKDLDKAIGANLRRLRVLAGLSQEALGKQLGVTFQQVQKYEKGTNRISGSRMVQIATALEVDVMRLFNGIERVKDASKPDPVAQFANIPFSIGLIQRVVGLPVEEQEKTIKLFRGAFDALHPDK